MENDSHHLLLYIDNVIRDFCERDRFFLLNIGPRIEMKQQAVFDTVVREIFDIVNDDELSFQRLDSYRIDGYTIIILMPSKYHLSHPATHHRKNGELIHLTNGYQSTFDTNGYKVYVSYPVQISAVDVKRSFG